MVQEIKDGAESHRDHPSATQFHRQVRMLVEQRLHASHSAVRIFQSSEEYADPERVFLREYPELADESLPKIHEYLDILLEERALLVAQHKDRVTVTITGSTDILMDLASLQGDIETLSADNRGETILSELHEIPANASTDALVLSLFGKRTNYEGSVVELLLGFEFPEDVSNV